ncbi:hypothetical protein DL765_008237 [Monosporascus sp. GIB2]|nr:hypothetical protein DL765_008237 [Monosporascus sp. GIB2]
MSASSSPADMEAVLNGPALPPPIGVTPDFDNPPKSNGSGYGVLTAMMAVGALALLLRLFAKAFRVKKLRLEDAILLEWLRIFNPTRSRNGFFWSSQIVLWTNILFYSASAIAINLACIPRQMIWDKTMVGGHCINENNLYLAGTIVNLVSDVTILILPQKIIWGLNLSLKRKIGLSFVFAIGLIEAIATSNESLHREVGVGNEAGIMRTTEFAAWESYVPDPERPTIDTPKADNEIYASYY